MTNNPALVSNPTIEVTWGEQSWEEMLFGAVLMRMATEEEVAANEGQSAGQDLASAD